MSLKIQKSTEGRCLYTYFTTTVFSRISNAAFIKFFTPQLRTALLIGVNTVCTSLQRIHLPQGGKKFLGPKIAHNPRQLRMAGE